MKAPRSIIPKNAFLLGGAFFLCMDALHSEEAGSLGSILESIRTLEGAKDAKCHATASRLENFMYGTPLGTEARLEKNRLVKVFVHDCWQLADRLARREGAEEIGVETLMKAQAFFPKIIFLKDGKTWVITSGKEEVRVTERDQKHYSSVAYALRAILAAQQERGEEPFTPLSEDALERLKTQADLYQLAVLKLGDLETRKNQGEEIQAAEILRQWKKLNLPTEATAGASKLTEGTPLLPLLVKQKLASYAQYNQISNQLFVRNIQVYFAKRRWPVSAEDSKALKEAYASAMINYTLDLYVGAQNLAKRRGDSLVREADVHAVLQKYTPFELNQFEDVIYFPGLGDDRVVMESYDLDSFRDGGLHWSYLGFALNESRGAVTMDADPFAAELVAEAIAQFGVLTWRLAGQAAIGRDEERLSVSDIEGAMKSIQGRVNRHLQGEHVVTHDPGFRSSPQSRPDGKPAHFTDVTAASGIDCVHRSSDWLSRLLRSYLESGEKAGIITIPPAFGGSGMAAEDIDNDGDADLLILSGAGNRLYRNDGGKFSDITAKAGLDWVRAEDRQPGEPRQPIIADLDNDGWQDILITYVDDSHRVYRNKGDGTFEDVTDTAGLGGKGLVAGPATVFDYDKDGLLDIYIGYFGNYLKGNLPTLERRNRNGSPNMLFRNLGGLRFEDVTEKSGTGDVGWGQAVGHTDLDGDGWQDLIVGNDFGVNSYFRNLGDGTFREISGQLGTDKPSYTMGIGITDLNRDGLPDIYISNIVTMNKDEKYVLPTKDTEMKFNVSKLANMRVVEANDLFLSEKSEDGPPKFSLSKLVDRGYSSTGWSWDADFFDYDQDGDDDLYVLNGMNDFNVYSTENPYYRDPNDRKNASVTFAQSNREKNILFSNSEGRLRQEADSGLELLSNARSAVFLDYDLDGDLDVAINNYHGSATLMENRTGSESGSWLKIRLEGNPEKGVCRDAIGARIIASGKGITGIWREVHGTTGFLSVHPKEQHFGLGDEKSADLTVIWPNGETQNFKGLATGRSYTLQQDDVPQVRN